jgi:hypothetical protein
MRTLVILGLAAFAAAPAAAQLKEQLPQIDPERVIPQVDDLIKLPDAAKPGQRRAAGCIKQQLYNIQSVDRYSVSFTVATSSGDALFNLEGSEIKYIPPSTPLPIVSTAETLKWTRFLDTLERAAATRRPVLVDYEMPSRDVFGVYIQWEDQCAD